MLKIILKKRRFFLSEVLEKSINAIYLHPHSERVIPEPNESSEANERSSLVTRFRIHASGEMGEWLKPTVC